MGLFDKRDKKKRDDFDSPVEQIDLSTPTPAPKPAPAPAPAPVAAAPAPMPAAPPAPTVAKQPDPPAPKPAPAPVAPRPTSPEADDYGIQKAIELMRTLPSDNIELVVQVVKFSLESVGIKLPVIIEDAIRRQKDIQGRIGVLKAEIADLEGEIKERKEAIDRHEVDHKETTMVRDRLELAENLGKPRPEGAAPTMPSSSASSSPMAASAGIPRVTRQTAPPPAGSPSPSSSSSSSSSSSGPLPTAPSTPVKK